MRFKFKSILRDIFPIRPIQDKLPKLTRRYSSPYGLEVRPDQEHAANYLKVHGVAKSRSDAARLLRIHPDKSLKQIVKLEKPKRRKMAAIERSWERLKKWL